MYQILYITFFTNSIRYHIYNKLKVINSKNKLIIKVPTVKKLHNSLNFNKT